MGLGALAGGVARGWQQGEDLKTQKADRDAKQYALDRKKKEDAADDDVAAMMKDAPVVGQQIADNPGVTDMEMVAAQRNARIARAPDSQPGFLTRTVGALAGAIRPHEAAVGAGVLPPPPVATDASGAPAAPTGGVLTKASTAPVPGPLGDTTPTAGPTVSPVEVTASTAPRTHAATLGDVMYHHMMALRTAGASPDKVMAATKDWFEQSTKENLGALANGDLTEASNVLQKMGLNVALSDSVDKDGKPDGGVDMVDASGKETHFASREALTNKFLGQVLNDPKAGIEFNLKFNADHRADFLARAQAANWVSDAKAKLMNANTAAAQVKLLQDEFHDKTLTRDKAIQMLTTLTDPDIGITDPAMARQATAVLGILAPEAVKGQKMTDVNGNTYETQPNAFQTTIQSRVSDFTSNPYVTGAGSPDGKPIVAPYNKNGVRGFVVRNPDNSISPVFSSWAQAQIEMRKAWGSKLDAKTVAANGPPQTPGALPLQAGKGMVR